MKATDKPIIVTEEFTCSRTAVWQAITEIAHMRKWYFENIPDFKAQVGFEVQFDVRSENRNFRHLWKIIEVVPGEKICYQWRYKEYPGDGTVEFALSGDERHARLILTNRVTEDFPQDIPEFKRESAVAGWTYLIKQCLPEYLNKKSVSAD